MRYKYQAIDHQGQELSGILTANTEREAIRELQRRHLTPLNLLPLIGGGSYTTQRSKKLKTRELLVTLHELATLLESDVSLIEAVESLAHSSHPPMITQSFANIARQLRQGMTFSTALKNSPLKLPWYVTQLIEAGELTGKVAAALRDGVKQMEYESQVSSEMRNAMIYPIILIVSGLAAILLIFTIVVPRFASILHNRADNIPVLAKMVLGTGVFLNNHADLLAIIVICVAILLIYLFSQARLRAMFKDMLAGLPVMGEWLIEAETARWAAMMSTLLENRVSLLRSLELAAEGIRLPSLNARLAQVSKAVRAGTPLSQALQDNDALPAIGHNLIRAGEKTGELARMLHSLASLLQESSRNRMKRFLLLIEPVAILTIGGVIGVIITGVILAITSVNQINF